MWLLFIFEGYTHTVVLRFVLLYDTLRRNRECRVRNVYWFVLADLVMTYGEVIQFHKSANIYYSNSNSNPVLGLRYAIFLNLLRMVAITFTDFVSYMMGVLRLSTICIIWYAHISYIIIFSLYIPLCDYELCLLH